MLTGVACPDHQHYILPLTFVTTRWEMRLTSSSISSFQRLQSLVSNSDPSPHASHVSSLFTYAYGTVQVGAKRATSTPDINILGGWWPLNFWPFLQSLPLVTTTEVIDVLRFITGTQGRNLISEVSTYITADTSLWFIRQDSIWCSWSPYGCGTHRRTLVQAHRRYKETFWHAKACVHLRFKSHYGTNYGRSRSPIAVVDKFSDISDRPSL